MNKTFLKFLLPIWILLVGSLACNFPRTSPTISEAWMARDYYGEQTTSVYNPEDIFYCVASLTSSPGESVVQAVWTAVNAEGVEPDQMIDQIELTTKSGTLHFELSNAGPWPAGSYKVDLYLNGVLDRTVEFIVQ